MTSPVRSVPENERCVIAGAVQDVDIGDPCAIDPVKDQIISVQSTARTLSLEGGEDWNPFRHGVQIKAYGSYFSDETD
nr:hypothetical protein [Sphingobium sp. AS12]